MTDQIWIGLARMQYEFGEGRDLYRICCNAGKIERLGRARIWFWIGGEIHATRLPEP